ncbi:MAG: aquaporin family protein [Bacteroidales bacterium]|nr:aquaporin family protein [Bacteroidales bacterium]
MSASFFEFLGTAIMMFMGNSVVANSNLNKTKGQNSGWCVITLAWGFAVMCGVFVAGPYSGAHLNPAVTLGFALTGSFSWDMVPAYIIAQILGGIFGGTLVYVFYKDHFDDTDDTSAILSCFCTSPAIRHYSRNLICEIMGTFVLVFIILVLSTSENTAQIGLGSAGAFPVTMLIMAIGMSLGGTTGYGINPARDLGPKIAHALLPIKEKGTSDWSYSWVPIVGPMSGAVLAGLAFILIY